MSIAFEDFEKLDIRIGKVLTAEKVEEADKLLKLEVDFGPSEKGSEESSERIIRQIISGIAEFYNPEDLVGEQFPFLVNLEPRTIRGLESQGMLLAADADGGCVLLSPDKEVKNGSKIR